MKDCPKSIFYSQHDAKDPLAIVTRMHSLLGKETLYKMHHLYFMVQ